MNKFTTTLKIILYPIYRLIFWYQVDGLENLPKDRGVIFCCNHISFMDPILWIIKVRKRIHFMAKEELFHNWFLRWILPKVDVFAIKRGVGDMSSLDNAVDLVNKGEIIGIFPEGTRSKTGEPGRAKSGVAYISNLAKCDVVPAAIYCKGKLRPFKKIKMVIGEPIPYADIEFVENDRKNLKRVSQHIMGKIVELWEGLRDD